MWLNFYVGRIVPCTHRIYGHYDECILMQQKKSISLFIMLTIHLFRTMRQRKGDGLPKVASHLWQILAESDGFFSPSDSHRLHSNGTADLSTLGF